MADKVINDGRPRVLVYGTLKSGHGNNGAFAETDTFLGKVDLELPFRMVDIGWYPGLVPTGVGDDGEPPTMHRIVGEVYSIGNDTLDTLDIIEGYPHYYSRRKVDTPHGSAWVYFLPPSYLEEYPLIESGCWRDEDDDTTDAA